MEIELDEGVRKEAQAVFDRLGLSESEAITLFYKRTAATGRLPFGEGKKDETKFKKKRMNERFAEWDAF